MMNYFQKKKLAFMSIVNRVKGFVRTITGTLPLTLEGCVDEESIIDYTLYGQSVQNGTPTPETPVEVESVGEKTTNLINWDLILSNKSITKVENGYHSVEYSLGFNNTTNIVKHIKSVLKSDTTYTLSRVYDGVMNASNGYIYLATQSGATVVSCPYGRGLKSATFSLRQEEIDSIQRLYITFAGGGGTISELQLTESDTVLPYEPYGYKIPIKVSGKNLFDIDDDFVNKCFNGRDGYSHYKMQLKPNTTYAVSVTENNQNNYIVISNGGEYNADDTGIQRIWLSHKTNSSLTLKPNKTQNVTTTDNGLIYLCVSTGYNVKLYKTRLIECISGLQIEEGATATDYEPYHETTTNIYLDEPLGEGQSINYKRDGLPNLPTFKGTSIISADTTVQPSNAEIEYYSNVKE